MGVVKGYALASGLAFMVAFFSGPDTPTTVWWLYIAGGALFALAAVGQYVKETKRAK